jgi:epsilon-lactone hydrolase
MASPQLQTAISMLKELVQKPAKTPQEMRANFEELGNNTPVPPDLKQEKVNAGGVPATWVCAPNAANDKVVLYLHGGGYVIGSVNTHRDLMARISRASGFRVLGLDYRLAPEHPFPAAVDDALAAYRWLLAQGIQPSKIAVAGDSAGGGLTAATLVAIRDAKLAMPAAGVLLSPWTDMEGLGDSMTTKASLDPVVQKDALVGMAGAYLGGKDPRSPLAAPIYADLKGLPPLLIQVGEAETLYDDSTRLAARAREAGVKVTLEPWPEMIHVWQMFAAFLPEGQQAIDVIGRYLRETIN